MRIKIILLVLLSAFLVGPAVSLDINSSKSLQYYSSDTLQLEVLTDGQINAQDNITLGGNSIENLNRLYSDSSGTNFFGSCTGGQVVESIDSDGTVNCIDPAEDVETENLSESLAAGNIANTTINIFDSDLSQSAGNIRGDRGSDFDDTGPGFAGGGPDIGIKGNDVSGGQSGGILIKSGDVDGDTPGSDFSERVIIRTGDTETDNPQEDDVGDVFISGGNHTGGGENGNVQIGSSNPSNLILNGNNITDVGKINNFFSDGCSGGQVVDSINSDGSVNCATVSTSTENLNATLEAGNEANQSIDMLENNINNPGQVDGVEIDNPGNAIEVSSNQYAVSSNSIDTSELASSSVTNTELGSDAVTNDSIDNSATLLVNGATLTSDLDLNQNDLTDVSRIEGDDGDGNFFNGACGSGEVVDAINADGSYTCVSVSAEAGGAEGLNATLAVGDIANTTIKMNGNNIDNPGQVDGVNIESPGNALEISSNSYAVSSNSIDTSELSSNAVTNSELGSGAVNNDSISSFNTFTMQTLDLTSDLTGTGVVNSGQISSGAVGSSELASDSVTNDSVDNTATVMFNGGTSTADLDINQNDLTDVSNIEGDDSDGNFFGSCSGGQVVESISSDGSVTCIDPSEDVSTETLSETLTAGNLANQTIGFKDKTGIKIGENTKAGLDQYSPQDIVIGRGAEASTPNPPSATEINPAVAIGEDAFADSGTYVYGEVAIGDDSNSSGQAAISVGEDSQATGDRASAIGYETDASAQGAIAIGEKSKALNSYEVTFGNLGSEKLDVNVTGNTTIHGVGNVSIENGALDMNGNRIHNFFSNGCSGGQVVESISSDGSVTCIDPAGSVGTDGLPATLAANNTANTSIEFDGSTGVDIGYVSSSLSPDNLVLEAQGYQGTGEAGDLVLEAGSSGISQNHGEIIIGGSDTSNIRLGSTSGGPDVNVTGNLTVNGEGNVSVENGALDLNDNKIHNFFSNGCSGGQVVEKVNADGSYSCIDPAEDTQTEGLNETLLAGDIANQSIRMDGNNIESVGNMTIEGIGNVTVKNAELDMNDNNVSQVDQVNPGGKTLDVGGDLNVGGSIDETFADLAEIYPSSQELEKGEIVRISRTRDEAVERSSQKFGESVGVVSTRPGLKLNAEEEGYPIALTGKVPVKVSVENGEIERGDRIVPSSDEGIGMRCEKWSYERPDKSMRNILQHNQECEDAAIGKALEPSDTDGKIMVMIDE